MTFTLNLDEGKYIVKLARRSIENEFNKNELIDLKDAPKKLSELCGVFVTLNKVKGVQKNLRGCIGYPYPIKQLKEAVKDVAVAAAFEDYRFPQVTKNELNEIIIEVSVLTPPETVKVDKPTDYPSVIKVSEDGLIIQSGNRSGLLLPQVPVEWNWDSEEFLSQCCIKAGLPPDAWLLPDTKIQKFQAIIFSEQTPRGEIIREELTH
ncbi:TIGR00296 family protein [Candidatus Bathyarchaeota archaeon]|nr:TIGR00296 family protein [Candidatus Bathyarchaeota archaeon]